MPCGFSIVLLVIDIKKKEKISTNPKQLDSIQVVWWKNYKTDQSLSDIF